MNSRLKRIVDQIGDADLRGRITEIVENPRVEIGGAVYTGLPLEVSPAGVSRHHSYPGGFIEHVVATAEIASTICNVTKDVYGSEVNRDLVLAGVVIHDIFKPITYRMDESGYFTSPLGERLEHLTLITAELIRRGLPLDLVHIACAHHGGQAGPIRPRTVEALICHLADVVDSQLNGEVLRAARYLTRLATGEDLKLLTSREAFGIVQSKTAEGWEGVKEKVKEIQRARSSD